MGLRDLISGDSECIEGVDGHEWQTTDTRRRATFDDGSEYVRTKQVCRFCEETRWVQGDGSETEKWEI